jgi:hypothetical protein
MHWLCPYQLGDQVPQVLYLLPDICCALLGLGSCCWLRATAVANKKGYYYS